MKIELNQDEVKVAIMQYFKTKLGIETCASDITLDGYSTQRIVTWERREEDTDGE
ncbi:MAG TPA: hypothetical protein VMW44_01075 [Candidatus Bathyarchaeia archaeon]|nr:hypothetical protein [Candidatus Bathyarchaeia archaeon]